MGGTISVEKSDIEADASGRWRRLCQDAFAMCWRIRDAGLLRGCAARENRERPRAKLAESLSVSSLLARTHYRILNLGVLAGSYRRYQCQTPLQYSLED